MSIFNYLPKIGHPFWKVSAIISCVILLYLTLTPSVGIVINVSHIDKLYHFIAFAGVTFLLMSAFVQINRWMIGFLMLALGLLIEIIQYQIPGRDFSGLDWLADAVGTFVVLMIFQKRRVEPQTLN